MDRLEITLQKRKERLGQIRTNSYGEVAKCIGFSSDDTSTDIIVELCNSKKQFNTNWYNFDHGMFYHNKGDLIIGTSKYNTQGSKMTIIEYTTSNNIRVKFETGYECTTNMNSFKNGNVRDLLYPAIYNIGIYGTGPYNCDSCIKGIRCYNTWSGILKRCYKPSKTNETAYKGCTVDEEWLVFQNFAKWVEANAYTIEGQLICVDKDILIKNNRMYGPDTCLLVPKEINNIFIRAKAHRGDLPIGVHFSKRKNKYEASVNRKRLGEITKYADTPEEAFSFYKEKKEEYIKYIADIYKDQIPQKVYDALYAYEVEITD